jgi:hypothetical protein
LCSSTCSVIQPVGFPKLPDETDGDAMIAFSNNSSSSIYDLFVWGTTTNRSLIRRGP